MLTPVGEFRQSAYLQQTALFLGQDQVFSYASALLKRFSGIDLSDKQIEKLCHHYGELLEGKSKDNEAHPLKKSSHLQYVMVDGSYMMSRKDGWVETKLGRIFKADDCLSIDDKRGIIRASEYVAHIGGYQDFCEKLRPRLEGLTRLVFIADGASWIWKWVQQCYPQGVQMLDFFHAYEKLCQWAVLVLKDKTTRQAWLEDMKALLLADCVGEVILQVQDTDCKLSEALDKKMALLTYFENNRHRMLYQTYRNAGYLIGSGPIESANRLVIQQRLKRSGQRWTLKGGQQVLNLRTANLSIEWQQVVDLVRMAA